MLAMDRLVESATPVARAVDIELDRWRWVARGGSISQDRAYWLSSVLPMKAERDAWELLQKVWTEGDPSNVRLPVDPFLIARKLGIQVFVDFSLSDEISGMLRKLPGYEDPEILLNGNDSRNRQRFTCAHEIGHYSQRVNSGGDGEWMYVDKRDPLSSEGNDPEEIYANKFAAELLMPEKVVEQRAGEYEVTTLAYEFGVSADAMRFRLDNLRIPRPAA
jgi:IrrE N-terminal-like domain